MAGTAATGARAWVQVINYDGTPRGDRYAVVPNGNEVLDLVKATAEKAGCPPLGLRVFASNNINGQSLPPESNWASHGIGQNEDRPFFVLLPPPAISAGSFKDPPELVSFWNALVNNTTEIQPNAVVDVKPALLLGDGSFGSAFFIRPCYVDLLRVTIEAIHTRETPHLVIQGNPGIGKTFFGFLLLLFLVRKHKTVVYESGIKDTRYLFSPNRVARGGPDAFDNLLENADMYYIVDAKKPRFYQAKTVLITSPTRNIWYEFSKLGCALRYMSVWEYTEIQCCRAAMFQHVSSTQVDHLFSQWGGIPRFVLQYANSPDQQQQLESAIAAVKDLNDIISSIGELEAPDATVHSLVHMVVESDFIKKSYRFASDYVADNVYTKLFQANRQQVIDFIGTSYEVSSLGAFRGNLFESHAHRIICEGGNFKVRPLVDSRVTHTAGDITEITLPKLELKVFSNDAEVLEGGKAYYFKPLISNYQSIDSFAKPNILFQMTVAQNHPCKQVGIHHVLKLLGNPVEPYLFFVIPSHVFMTGFLYLQPYEDADGRIMNGPSYSNVKQIKQFALSIDLTSHQR